MTGMDFERYALDDNRLNAGTGFEPSRRHAENIVIVGRQVYCLEKLQKKSEET
jgi:hypothetical protein